MKAPMAGRYGVEMHRKSSTTQLRKLDHAERHHSKKPGIRKSV